MNNNLLRVKIKQRLNKLSSSDYDNVQDWQIIEAFNKASIEFARRQAKKGEESKQDIEDIQVLLKQIPLKGTNKKQYFESVPLPEDFLSYKRVNVFGATSECSEPRSFKTYLVEEANINDILKDVNLNPNFEWAETVVTIMGNKLKIYSDNKFTVKTPSLVYYRKPKPIQIIGQPILEKDVLTLSNVEVVSEFKDDVVEVLIDEAVIILAGDIESFNQVGRETNSVIRNE